MENDDIVVKLDSHKEADINSNDSIQEIKKFKEALKILGLYIRDDDSKRAILDYSKVVSNFKKLLEQQQNSYSSIATYAKDNEVILAHIADLNKNLQKISEYFEALMSFFINPPSKEIFELTNHALIIKNVYESFKDFSDKFDALHINEQFDTIGKDFSKHISKIKLYQDNIEAKLENMAKTYDDFLNEFLNKQTKQLDNFNNKSLGLAKTYDDFLHKNLKFFKGGTWSLIILNIALAITLGALGVYCSFKSNELNKLLAIGEQFAEISIKIDEKSINLDFPENAKFIESGNTKRIILKKD